MSASAINNLADHGITHLAANEIMDWMAGYHKTGKKPPVPGYNTFHPTAALPFHGLIYNFLRDDRANLRSVPDELGTALTYYDETNVSDAPTWRRMTSIAKIGYVEES